MAAEQIRVFAVAAAIVVFQGMGFGAEHEVKLRVTPTVASAPATVRIYVSVTQNEENRMLRVVANSEEYSRVSEMSMEGQNSPKVSTFEYRELPPGSYDVRVYLIGRDGRTRDSAWCAVVII